MSKGGKVWKGKPPPCRYNNTWQDARGKGDEGKGKHGANPDEDKEKTHLRKEKQATPAIKLLQSTLKFQPGEQESAQKPEGLREDMEQVAQEHLDKQEAAGRADSGRSGRGKGLPGEPSGGNWKRKPAE